MKQIIGYSVDKDNRKVFCSNEEVQTQTPYLDFLVKQYPDSIKVFSDLDSDVAQLLSMIDLTAKELEKLANTNRLTIPPYEIMYIPRKWFSIDMNKYRPEHKWSGFSDMSQYADIMWNDIPKRAETAAIVGYEVYRAFTELGFNPTQLISPANVYRKERIDELDLPKFDDIPAEAMGIAYDCCKGNWLEAFAIGHWNKVYDYDINSAYPYQASRLLDLRQGTWKQSKEYQIEASYGYCRCEVMIDKDFSPIIKQYGDKNYTPKGVFNTSLTKAEIDFINKWQLGYVTIIDGWWWFGNGVNVHPLDAEIKNLYKEKEKATGIKKEIIKRIMSGSFYGMFIELRGNEFGEYFFAPYAAEIESRTRLQIADTCLRNNIIPIHIAVDGIITNKFLETLYTEGIGSWRLEHEGKALICSSGLTAIEGKNGKGDFSVSYDYLMDKVKPTAIKHQIQKAEILTLAQAKNLGRIKDVGKVEIVNRDITFGDTKREYEQEPKNFGELVNGQFYSKAWDNEMIEALEQIEEVEI